MMIRSIQAASSPNRNLRACEAAHLPDEKESGLIVAPVAVVQIARDDDEGDLFLDGQIHQICECQARGRTNEFCRWSLLTGKPLQGTVEMNVAGMQKSKTGQCLSPNEDSAM
jgi:hypothetical protein